MKYRWIVIIIAILCIPPFEAHCQKAVILVRHTERLDQSADSVLSPLGIERARVLAERLKDAGIRAIYSSERRRSIQTAEPVAALLKINLIAMPSANAGEMITRIQRENANDIVLIVGHSNTIPDLIKRFGAAEQLNIADPEYDNLFILIPQAGRPALLLRLHF